MIGMHPGFIFNFYSPRVRNLDSFSFIGYSASFKKDKHCEFAPKASGGSSLISVAFGVG
jgi:hypothetical protein